MEKDEEPSGNTSTAWGTWEELLLASAVHRHGLNDWDSVAMEVQARSSLPNLLITAHDCELKYHDLKRRFDSERRDGVESGERENGTDFGDETDGSLWIDELRKLRVAELRQEVQRSDFSIHSLQLKVERLEEERDRSLKEKEISLGKPDLEKSREQRSENDNKFSEKSDRSEPEGTVKLVVSGEESDGEYHSVNESNSTGSKSDDAKTGEENTQSESKPGLFCSDRSEPLQRDSKPVTADSDNGSSDTVAKNPACETLERSLEKKVHESSELNGSLARSNGGDEATRESSEVQSSASLAGKKKRKNRHRREVPVNSIGDEARPPATVVVEQLEERLGVIQAHHHSWLFESRVQSQELEEYKKLVKQHIDLETVRGKVHEGSYVSLSHFYRDLLLLFTNAIIFFPKSSVESIAATELLHLVSDEMKKTRVFPTPRPSPDASLPVPSQSQIPKLERSDSLLAKQKSSVPIIVCRKRSSIAAKTSTLASIGNKGEEYHNDEKKSFDLKPPVKSTSAVVEEPGLIKENTVKEKTVTGARSLRRINGGFNNVTAIGSKKQNTSGGLKSAVPLDKRRSAADFLKRIKQNSPADNLNNKGGGTGGGEEKKSGVRREKGAEKSARQGNSPSKRGVGRPPKKVAEKNGGSTKRAREGGGGKEPIKRPRKRSKR